MSDSQTTEPFLSVNNIQVEPSSFLVEARGYRHWLACVPVCILYVGYMLYLAWAGHLAPAHSFTAMPPVYHMAYLGAFWLLCLLALYLAEALFRLLLLVEELGHVPTRYKGQTKRALERTLLGRREGEGLEEQGRHKITFSVRLFVILVPVLLVGGYLVSTEVGRQALKDCWDQVHLFVITTLIFNSVVLAGLKLRGPSAVEQSSLMEKSHTNVAHGLAWGYYIGFLKIILPEVFNSMKETIQGTNLQVDDRVRERLKSAKVSEKVVVLIPESCRIPKDALRISDNQDSTDSRHPVICCDYVGKAKVQQTTGCDIGRSYDQSIYLISSNQQGDKGYCVLVCYATPLHSLFEMSNAPEAGLDASSREEQMRLFYTSLKEILRKSEGLEDKVLLIPFHDHDDDGNDVHPAKIVWSKLMEVEKQRQVNI